MNRFLCVWLPNWSIHRLVVEQPELRHQPIILHARDSRQRQLVIACSSSARSLGVRVQMSLVDATAMAEGKNFYIRSHNSDADELVLNELAAWCNRFSPVVAVDSPDSLLFDLKGVTHLYGDEPKLAHQVLKEFYSKGYRPRVAIADTPSAAWAASHYFRSSATIVPQKQDYFEKSCPLFELPVVALRISDAALEKLNRLGIHRIGQLVELHRENLPSRIGQEVLNRLDCLTGDKVETIFGNKPLPEFEQQWLLDRATDHWETIQHVVHVLLKRLANQLYRYGHGVTRLTVCFDCTTGHPAQTETGLYRPSADACHLNHLVQMQLETANIPAAVECVTVIADATEPLEQIQQSLLETENTSDPREVAELVEKLSSRLGPDRVVKAVPVDDWQPERAFSYQPMTGLKKGKLKKVVTAKSSDSFFNSRPLRMFFPPKPIHVIAKIADGPPTSFHFHGQQRIANYWGPERLETGWWHGPCVKRDYYRVETESASRFWLFRRLDDDQWFLHGIFD